MRMRFGKNLLAVVLALTLVGQTVAVDYLHHHPLPARACHGHVTGATAPGDTFLAPVDAHGSAHDAATCPFCLFLQNWHGRPAAPALVVAGVETVTASPATALSAAPRSGHLHHAGPRAPPVLPA